MAIFSPQTRGTLLLPALLFALSACAVPAYRYLSTGLTSHVYNNDPDSAVVLLRPFTENFAADAKIGRHLFTRERETKLLVKPGRIGQAIDILLREELIAKDIAVAEDGINWDQTPEGLNAFGTPTRLLLSGKITRLSLDVNQKLLSGKARIEMDVECVLGLVGDKKVLRRNVHVAQEMVTVSFDQEELEKLLADCLKKASEEILAQCSDLVAFLPSDSLPQPGTAKINEQEFVTGNERISETNRRRDSRRTTATGAGTVSL